MLDEQSVFIKAERLFELDQDLLGQSVTMLLLKDQAAKQPHKSGCPARGATFRQGTAGF
jgi:hypothetical protein